MRLKCNVICYLSSHDQIASFKQLTQVSLISWSVSMDSKDSVLHQIFATTAPHLRGRVGDSRDEVQGNYFSSSSQWRRNDGVLTLGSLPQGDFLLRKAEQSFNLQFAPWGWGL